MGSMQSQAAKRLHPQVYSVTFVVLLVSLAVFFHITPNYTGFVTATPQDPDAVALFLSNTIFYEGETILGDLDVAVSGPLDELSVFYADIGSEYEEMGVVDALNISGISFSLSAREMQVQGSSSSKTLAFPSKGKQLAFLNLPSTAVVQSIDLDIHGLPGATSNASYPSFLTIDVGLTGTTEWEYLGDLINYSTTFALPSGLDETTESSVILTDEEAYYCEIISLPRAKDFRVFAKYGLNAQGLNTPRDMEALIYSLQGSSSTITAEGGSNVCDLEDPNSTQAQYYNCDLPLTMNLGSVIMTYAIEGNHLVCVSNAENFGTGGNFTYDLSKDSDKGVGYRCGPRTGGQATCQLQTGDFYIKVQQGLYSGTLNKRIVLAEGFTGQLLEDVLNNYISSACQNEPSCIIPLAISTKTPGIVLLDNLKIRYTESGSLIEEKNFYDVTFTPATVYEIDGEDLTQPGANVTFTLFIDDLDLQVPSTNKAEKNFTLKAGISPGPSDKMTVLIRQKNATTNVTAAPTDLAGLVKFYRNLLNTLLLDHDALLTALDYKTEVSTAINTLATYTATLATLNQSNKTAAEIATEKLKIENDVNDLLEELPHYVHIADHVVSDMAISLGDLTDAVVFSYQTDDASKKKIYSLQQSLSISTDARSYRITQFNGADLEGTLVSQQVQSGLSDAFLVTILPPSLASTVDDVIFSVTPEVVQPGNPVIVRWPISQVPSSGVSYVFPVNIMGKLEHLKSVVVPRTIPKEVPSSRARCGDGFCSVVTVNGVAIPLEDKYSCPQDCKTVFPLVPLSVIVILFALLIFYFGFYSGKYNYHELLEKFTGKKQGTVSRKMKKPFASPTDEINLRNYIIASLKKGVAQPAIVKNLLAKGWKKEQVDFIMQSLKK